MRISPAVSWHSSLVRPSLVHEVVNHEREREAPRGMLELYIEHDLEDRAG